MDDPFVNQAYTQDSDVMSGQRSALPQRASVRMPPAARGTTHSQHPLPPIRNQRYPENKNQPIIRVQPPSLAGQVSKRPEEYAQARALNDPRAAARAHIRDPHPYTGFTAPGNKTEILMQCLQKINTEKSRPNTGRTVLYDPVAQQGSKNSSLHADSLAQTSTPTRIVRPPGLDSAGFHHDLLRASDPLPPMAHEGEMMGSAQTAPITEQQLPLSLSTGFSDLGQLNQGPHSSNTFANPLTYDQSSLTQEQEQREIEILAWFTDKQVSREHVRALLERSTLLTQPKTLSTPPQEQRPLAPIGSGRRSHLPSSNQTPSNLSNQSLKSQQSIANDLMAPTLANLHLHALKDPTNPFTRYAQPPAWCIDSTSGGRQSLMGETEWNPPPRVGRDPRYPTTFHEGRPTYFEEVGRVGGRR